MEKTEEENARCFIILEQLAKLRLIDYDKYFKISRDLEDIVYPTTSKTSHTNKDEKVKNNKEIMD